MKKALVTGGAGFIGSHVVDALVEKGLEVFVIDNLSSGSLSNLNEEECSFYDMDIRHSELLGVFKKYKPDYVFHLAAQINVRNSIKNPKNDADINVIGSLNLLDNCVKYGVKKIIFSSTGGAIYGDTSNLPTSETEKENPESPYGIAKLTIEKYLSFYKKTHGLDYISLRYGNVYGPRQDSNGEAGVIAIFINNILSGINSKINGDGEQTRDYVYVKDVANANILAMNLSGVYNVGTGIETNVNDIFRKIIKLSEKNPVSYNAPEVKGELLRSCLDSSKLRKNGWKRKYDLDKGLEETMKYFQS